MNEDSTIGAFLRATRRQARIGIEEASEATRIRADFLMRMESDEFDFLSPAYVRGFLKSYARYLGVDPGPLLKEFDRRLGTGPVQTAELVALQRSSDKNRVREPVRISRWAMAAMFAGGVFLLLFVLGMLLGPDERDQGANVARRAPPATAVPTPPPTSAPVRPPPREEALAFRNGINVEVIAVYDRCWIDVTADGKTIFSNTLEKGDNETFKADKKMAIVFGYPSGVELIVNGKHLGAPGGGGANPTTVTLPDDIKELL